MLMLRYRPGMCMLSRNSLGKDVAPITDSFFRSLCAQESHFRSMAKQREYGHSPVNSMPASTVRVSGVPVVWQAVPRGANGPDSYHANRHSTAAPGLGAGLAWRCMSMTMMYL